MLSKELDDAADSETENEGIKINESLLIVPGTSLLKLLSKCHKFGCSAQVLPSNIRVSKKGNSERCKQEDLQEIVFLWNGDSVINFI